MTTGRKIAVTGACRVGVALGAGPTLPHEVVYGGLTRPSAPTIGSDGAFHVANCGFRSGIGEVLRIEA